MQHSTVTAHRSMRLSLAALALFCCLSMPLAAFAKVPVMVSIVPLQYFTERIGGDFVDVSVMVQPGASPATYEPKPRQMADLSRATLYIAIGVPFEEAWLPRIQAANPDMRIIHADAGLTKLPMAAHHHHMEEADSHDQATHSPDEHHDHMAGHEEHGHDHDTHAHEGHDHAAADVHGADHDHDHEGMEEHHHGGLDPHIWLSPMMAKPMAENIKQALIKADPAHAPVFRANFTALEKELDALDVELHDIFAVTPPENRVFMVFHPSWGYFAMNYNLRQVPIEYEGKEPTPKILQMLMEEAQEEHIRTVFIQPQFARKSAEAIAAHIKGKVVVADPLAADWPENLRRVARDLTASFAR